MINQEDKKYRAVIVNPIIGNSDLYGWTGEVEYTEGDFLFTSDGDTTFTYDVRRGELYIPELDGAWPSYSKMKPREQLQ